MRKLLFLVVLAACQVAGAQVTITVPDEPIEANRHYLLKVAGLEAADLPNTQLVAEPKTASAVGVSGWAGEQFIWFSGTEKGRHFVAVIVVRAGKPVVASATVEVGGSTPNPDPPPPPPPSKLVAVVIIREQGEQTPKQAAAMLDLGWRKYLIGLKVRPRVTDPDVLDQGDNVPQDLATALTAAAKTEGPDICFVFADSRVVCEPLPDSAAALLDLVKQYGGGE